MTQHGVTHRFGIGDEISFAKSSGISRGRVARIEITVTKVTQYHYDAGVPDVVYTLDVKNKASRETHQETVPEAMTATTFDEAWAIFEKSFP